MCLNICLLETLPPASLHLISSWKSASLKLISWITSWPFLPGVTGDSCLCCCLHPKPGSLSHCPPPHPSLILLPCPSPKFPADVCMSCQTVRQSQGTAVTCRLPVTRGCCPAELRDSPAALHVISSLALLLQVKDQVPFQSLVLQALLDIITIMWLIKLSQIYANIGPWPRPFVYVFDQPQFLIWQHIKTYRWIKIDHNFPIKYDSLQIVTQPVTAAIHRA